MNIYYSQFKSIQHHLAHQPHVPGQDNYVDIPALLISLRFLPHTPPGCYSLSG